VTLGDYTAIRLAPREAVVTEEQVDEVIERLRQQRGTWIDLEEPRPAAKGDLATIDLASSIDGEPLEETQQDVPAVLGEPNGLLPELESAIIGLNVGDQTSTTVTFPEDYRQEKVAGKEVRFDITLKKLQARQLPDLDDAFVASVTDLTSLEALRQRVRENLQEKATEDVRREMAQAVIDLVTDQATVEMPPVLVNNQIDRQLHERQHVFERQGLRWENVLQMLGKDEEQVREEERPLAERRVRSSLTLLEIARVEGLEVSASEVDEEIERLVSGYDDPRQARRNFERPAARQAIESSLFETRIIDRLVEIATEGRGYIAAPGEGGQLPGAAEITATAETSEPDTPADAEPADETASDAPTDARPSA
jgi:trigger factor